LGTRAVRPGNPVYLRVIDADASKTPAIDQLYLTLQTSSGDEIRKLAVQETAPFSGEFEVVIPTAGAQAIAFASESAPGRDPNMAVSAQDYPGWQGKVGDKGTARTFGVDLNDNVAAARMTVQMEETQALTHFVLQTSMNGKEWTTRARYPEDTAPWDGRPVVTSFPTYRGGFPVSNPEGLELPEDWHEKMEQMSSSPSCGYLAAYVPNLTMKDQVVVNTGHPGYSGLVRFRTIFYQPNAAVRKFKVTGLPVPEGRTGAWSLFFIDGQPADEDAENPLEIERELAPGLHTIDIWHHGSRARTTAATLAILCDQEGSDELLPCPDTMFDPTTFPVGVQAKLPQPAKITKGKGGQLDIEFGDHTQTRLVRFVITGFQGVAPAVKKVTLADRAGKQLLPVGQDFMALRQNQQLEVLPGDTITARYEDPVSATPKRNRHEQRITVAFNTATLTASFLNYETDPRTGERTLKLEPIRRFQYDDPVALVIEDADMDGTPARDVLDFRVETSNGQKVTLKAVETEEHSGRFIGRVFPVKDTPSRDSEIQLPEGGILTAYYRDAENLDPGIPTDRMVTISHAQYVEPAMGLYTIHTTAIPEEAEKANDHRPAKSNKRNCSSQEVVKPRQTLVYDYIGTTGEAEGTPVAVQGAGLRFDVVSPHLAFAGSSTITAYVQTNEGVMAFMKQNPGLSAPPFFSKDVPGTLKVTGTLNKGAPEVPDGYTLGSGGRSAGNAAPLEEGRFHFNVPLVLGDLPVRSYANKSAEKLPESAFPVGLAVKAGEEVYVGFEWATPDGETKWIKHKFLTLGHAFLDVMQNGYSEPLTRVYVGEKVYIRLIARNLDKGPERDVAYVGLGSTSGTKTRHQLQETEGHSGVFKGVFSVSYDDRTPGGTDAELPPVALNGFPVKYGDTITVSYEGQERNVEVNNGADGGIQPFSKRYTGDEMAVRTSFTLAECFFELAKKHREMEQESLARREIGHARKLLAEALATHRDEELKAHAEYLLGNLAQEFADLAKNDVSKLPMYQDALARFSKIPTDYPESEFAAKAQFKTALVYEKMGEIENAVEEYVKLAYKYPDHELIPSVMSRLGDYFQKKGQELKDRAKPLREKTDELSVAEVLRLDGLSYPEFLNAAMVFTKLLNRFPDDPLAGLAGIRAGQNFMRALQYEKAIDVFQDVINNENFEGGKIRAQALFWGAYSRELFPTSESDYRTRGNMVREAYQMYRRITFDFPDSIWAKRARGRLADQVFERIIEVENQERERMLEALKKSK
jgi:outer membrane protein assembly factor BamD (BamD/ComL family)